MFEVEDREGTGTGTGTGMTARHRRSMDDKGAEEVVAGISDAG